MKKFLFIFLVLSVCVSLASCGQSTDYSKYDSLISSIEKGDYEGAHAELDRLAAFDENTTVPEYSAVEITLDNWSEYYEIVEVHETSLNNFDEVEDMYKTYKFVLKDGYDIDTDSTQIDIEFNYTKEWRYVTVDKENETLTIGELVEDRQPEDMEGVMITAFQRETNMLNSREYSDNMQAVPCNVEITRIEGTLYIAE